MKSLLTLLALSGIIFSCNNSGGKSTSGKDTMVQQTIIDTTFPISLFLTPDSTQVKNEVVAKIRVATKTFVGDDASLNVLEIRKDSFYFSMGQTTLTDSLGKPILDTATNQPKIVNGFVIPIPNTSVWDTGIMRDSANKRFAPHIKIKPAGN